MKTNVITSLVFVLLSLWGTNLMHAQPIPFCQTFDEGSNEDGWSGTNANTFVLENNGGFYLGAWDLDQQSWIYNNDYTSIIMGCGDVSYDYHVKNDGFLDSLAPVTDMLHLISENNSTGQVIRAKFVLDFPLYENTGIQNIISPVHPIQPGDPLPSNAYGTWTMMNPLQWNELVTTFNEVAFSVDIAGSGNQTEVFHLDNFCYIPYNFETDTTYTTDTDCIQGEYIFQAEGVQVTGHSYTWKLFETTVPYATTGGTQVGDTQVAVGVTFGGLEANKYYYFEYTIHDICEDVFYTYREALPFHPIGSLFLLEDEDGQSKTTFCYGEEVFLDGTYSYGENNFWIGVSRKPYPDNGQNWQDWADIGWEEGQVGVENLSEAFANINYDFEPGWEYNIKLAVQNKDECVNWVQTVHSFVVECCEDYLNGAFELDISPIPNSDLYALEAIEYDTFLNADVEHTWHIFSSPNQNEDAYFLEAVLTGETLYYEVPEDQCYLVIHSLDTPCGEFCYGDELCIFSRSSGHVEQPCNFCGPIECEVLEDICEEPQNPRELCAGPNLWLGWDAVAGAANYVIEVSANDDNCCETELTPFIFELSTTNTFINISYQIELPWDCIRWRVRAECGGEISFSTWSDYQCHANCRLTEREISESDLPNDVSLYPNPTNSLVLLEFEHVFTGNVQLMDKLGRVIETASVVEISNFQFDLSKLPNGLYWVQTQNQQGTQAHKLLKQ